MPYIGVSPQFGVRRKHTYTATAGQTIFTGAGSEGATLSYTDSNFVDVYQNGVKLGDADYTSTSGTQIVLTQAASVDDLVEIIVFDAFSAADTVSKADGGTFDGNVTMSGTLGVTGAITSSAGATITTADNTAQLTLKSTDADANSGPLLDMKRDSSSPAADDFLGQVNFIAENNASEETTYAQITGRIEDVTDGAEDGRLTLKTMRAGSSRSAIDCRIDQITINDDGDDVDFRVESDGNANMLFVDGGNNQVLMKTTDVLSNTTLRVEGNIKQSNGGQPTTGNHNQFVDNLANSYNTMFHNRSSNPLSQFIMEIGFKEATPDNGNAMFIDMRDATTARCQIRSDGDIDNHDNSYSGFSDEKLKEQIKDASSQWEDVKALTIRKFKFKTDVATGDSDAHWRLGVIAQEVEKAGMNGLVTTNTDIEEKDGINSETGTTTKSVKYSILYMKAVKALQEAMTRIEKLEAEVKALKGE
tara:strand:+ start:53 stop:1474 length:1422 start_codon:yes stop_codon:yes gene_type:complete